MAIENIEIYKHDINNGELAIIASVKINEIIDYINSKDHVPDTVGKVEQEPHKVELVPLDIEKIISDVKGLLNIEYNQDGSAYITYDSHTFQNILSKYGVPKQKKFTGKELQDYCEQEHLGDSIASYTYITSFLRHKNMIEE